MRLDADSVGEPAARRRLRQPPKFVRGPGNLLPQCFPPLILSRPHPMQIKNLPAITGRYWAAILAASICGANTGDFLARKLHLGHQYGLPPLTILFGCIFWAERRAAKATEAYYWLAIIVVRTAATNLADLATRDLKLGYGLVEPGLIALLVGILFIGSARSAPPSASEGPAARRGTALPKTDATYWLAMLTAGTLGTATGDFVAAAVGLVAGSAVLSMAYAGVLAAGARAQAMTIFAYWTCIVAARTAGTTMGDLIARHLGLSLSTLCTWLLLAGVLALRRQTPLRGARKPQLTQPET